VLVRGRVLHLTGFDRQGAQSKLPGLKVVCVCVCELVTSLVEIFKTRTPLTSKMACQDHVRKHSQLLFSLVRIWTIRTSQHETTAPEFRRHLTNVY